MVGGGVALFAAYRADRGVGLYQLAVIHWSYGTLTACKTVFCGDEQTSHYCRQNASNGNSLPVYVQAAAQKRSTGAAPTIAPCHS